MFNDKFKGEMKNKAKIDPATGLPELPHGQIWRVERYRMMLDMDYHDFGYKLSIVEVGGKVTYKHKWLSFLSDYPKKIVEDRVLDSIVIKKAGKTVWDLDEDVIRDNALTLMEDISKHNKTKSFVGDYPPNKLS